MRLLILSVFLLSRFCSQLSAQTVLFEKDYAAPGDYSDIATHCNTSDSGMVLFSHTVGQGFIHYNVIVKTTADGTVQWTRRLIVPNSNKSNIIQLTDGSFCFSWIEGTSNNTYRVVKFDTSGNTVYSNTYVLPGNYHCVASPVLCSEPGGGFYLSSSIRSVSVTYAWTLMEMDAAGNLLWSRFYNDNVDVNISMTRCANGDVLVCGSRGITMSATQYPFITRINSSGLLLWSKYYTYSGSHTHAYAIQELGNGNIAVAGRISGSMSVPNEAYYLQTDAGGVIINSVRYSNAQSLLQANSAIAVENNNLVISGNAGVNGNGTFCAKLDAQCNVLSVSFYTDVYGFSLGRTTGGPGYSVSGMEGNIQHMLLFTTDTTVNSCISSPFALNTAQFLPTESALTGSNTIAVTQNAFQLNDTILPLNSADLCPKMSVPFNEAAERLQLYPNPATDFVVIQSDQQILSVEIFDLSGRLVISNPCAGVRTQVNVTSLIPGCYIIHIIHENHVESQRLIIE